MLTTKMISIFAAVSATCLVAWGATTNSNNEQPTGFVVPNHMVPELDAAANEPADTPAQDEIAPSIEPRQTVPNAVPEATSSIADADSASAMTGVDAESPVAAESNNGIEGFTEPYADIEVAASEMGTLASVGISEGDSVKANQLIAQLDDEVLRASLKVADAGMKAVGELETAKTQFDLRSTELKKLTQLFDRQHASQQELDRIAGEVRVAQSRIQTVTEDQLVRRLEFARIQAQIRQREIRSPIDGVIVDVRKDRGEFVSPSDPVVARIVQLDPLLVMFDVPTAHRQNLSKNQSVAMSLGAAGSRAVGQIEFVSPIADASSGTFRVKVRLPNANRRWLGGEKAVLLPNETPDPAIAVNKK